MFRDICSLKANKVVSAPFLFKTEIKKIKTLVETVGTDMSLVVSELQLF